ncbi:MAG: serpin family protein [Fimbriimonadaceae bacterium]|nr:serpin family protein [Fimbriimonadaceae bacterium]
MSGVLLSAMIGAPQGGGDATMNAVFRDRDGSPTAVARSVFSFGHAILKKVAAKEANVCVSPISLWFPFSLVYQGSSGVSQRDMAALLVPADPGQTVQGARAAIAVLNRPTPGFTVSLQNAAWFRPDSPPSRQFQSLATGPFASRVFAVSAEKAPEAINAWVNEATRGKIPSLLDTIHPQEGMVLANAAYLKAEWTKPFPAYATTPRPFFVDGEREVKVPTMSGTFIARYVGHPDFLVAAIPYKDEAGWLVLAMPKEGHAMGELWKADLAAMHRAVLRATPTECIVTMPKWKTATDLDLKKTLSSMGMVAPWSPRGEFAAIHRQAFLSRAIHKARIEVDEKGTEAAAATAIGVGLGGGASDRKLPPILTFNRPFYYAVVERTTGLPLFAGVLNDPSK